MRGVFSARGILLLCAVGITMAPGLAAPPPAEAAIELNAFGDVTYTNRSADDVNGSNNGFALGQLDLYTAEQIDDRTTVFMELVIEEDTEGNFVSDLERLQITYQFNNTQRLRAGRFHSMLGYWNRAFHHGAHLQTTIRRPFFLEFEDTGGVLPTHAVGLWWSGRWNGGSGRLETGLMVHNGASITWDSAAPPPYGILDAGTTGDSDNRKTVAAMVAYQPAAIQGLEVGLSGQFGTVVITDLNGAPPPTITKVEQRIGAAHLAWPGEQTELIAEVFRWEHDIGGTGTSSTAWYVQAGGRVGKGMLYMRYETLEADSDAYFDSLGFTTTASRRHTVGTFGIRFDLHFRSAIKLELGQVDDDAEGTYDTASAQWSFSF